MTEFSKNSKVAGNLQTGTSEGTDALILIDNTTEQNYRLFVDGGKLKIEEVISNG